MKRTAAVSVIPTRYRGCFFRSRLEARWAVFFDTMGIRFHYEPEGFLLPDGTKYLPDFYLPEIKWLAEVKPLFGQSSKAFELVRHSGYSALILDGEPAFRSYTGFIPGPAGPENVEFSLDVWTFRKHFEDEQRLYSMPDYEAIRNGLSGEIEKAFSIRYRAGVDAALSARFE